MSLEMELGLDLGDFVLDGNPALPPQKGGRAPKFSAHCCGQTAGWMNLVLGTEVGLSPGDFVIDGDPAKPPTSPKGARPPQFSANVRCGQTDGWTKMPLGVEVVLGPGDFVFDGDAATPEKRHINPSPHNLWPMSIGAKRLDGSRCHLVGR